MSQDGRCPDCSGLRGLPRLRHDLDPPVECTNPFHTESVPEAEPEKPGPKLVPDPEPPTPMSLESDEPVSKPACPWCGMVGKVQGSMTTLGPARVMVVTCGNPKCRKILFGFQVLEMIPMPPPDSTPV